MCSLPSFSQNQLMWKAEKQRSSAYIESRQQWTDWTDWRPCFLSFLLDLDGAYLSAANDTFHFGELGDDCETTDDHVYLTFWTKYGDGKCKFAFYISKNGEYDYLYHTYMGEKTLITDQYK